MNYLLFFRPYLKGELIENFQNLSIVVCLKKEYLMGNFKAFLHVKHSF